MVLPPTTLFSSYHLKANGFLDSGPSNFIWPMPLKYSLLPVSTSMVYRVLIVYCKIIVFFFLLCLFKFSFVYIVAFVNAVFHFSYASFKTGIPAASGSVE